MRDLLVLLACSIALVVAYALLVRVLRTVLGFLDELLELAVALVFCVLIVPPLWLWHKARRPMWRTLSREQTRELEAWLRRAT